MTSLTRARAVLFVVLAIALAIPALAFIDERVAQWIARTAAPVVKLSARKIGQLQHPMVFAAVSFGWSLVVGFALIYWMRAAYAFARNHLRVRDVEYRSWVFWSWLIPVINLYKPCQVLREIHRCGHPSAGKIPLSDLRSSAALVVWWIIHRALHFLFFTSLVILGLWAASGIFLSPFASPAVQTKWTAGIYALLTVGWFFVAAALTARLRRHPAFQGDAAEEDVEQQAEEEDEDDWSDGDEHDDVEEQKTFFSAAYRREPLIEDLPEPQQPVAPPPAPSPSAARVAQVTRPSLHVTSKSPSVARAAAMEEPSVPVPPLPSAIHVPPPPRERTGEPETSASFVPLTEPQPDEVPFDEAAAYDRIAEELETGRRERGAWLRAVVESGADEARQPVIYAQLRLRQLRLAHEKELMDVAERQRMEEQERIESERAAERRQAAERYLLDAFHHQDAVTLDGAEFLEVVRVAVDENRVNQRSRSNGKTLLHMAVERVAFHTRMADEEVPGAEMLAYDRRAIRMLLDAGADPGLRDRNARSAHDYARAVGIPLRQMA